jgi:hypothetical protein
MRTIIKQNKADWIDRNAMTPTQYAIQQWLDKFDKHLVEVESRWGVDRLHKLVSQDMVAKWSRQMDKLNAAIQSDNLDLMPDLVNGAIRGCGVMEAQAKAAGHSPHDAPLCWTVATPKGRTLAIVRHGDDAALLQGNGQNILIYTIEEIAAIIDGHQLVDKLAKDKTTLSVNSDDFDFTKGDEIIF